MIIPQNKGDIYLCYNYETDELFLLKRGCIFAYYLLEDEHGTSFNKNRNEFIKSSSLLQNYVVIEKDF
jgi:hypothetical protein